MTIREAGRRMRRVGGVSGGKPGHAESRSVQYDGLYFAGLGRSLVGPNSGITTFEDADRLLSVFLGRPVSTDASKPGQG